MTNSHIFPKTISTNLEIISEDNVSLYVEREYFLGVSDYFTKLLCGNFKESFSDKITMKHHSFTLSLLINCILNIHRGKKIINTYFSEIKTFDDLHMLISACNEYQLTLIRELADEFFSHNDCLKKFMATDLISFISTYDMVKMMDGLKFILSSEAVTRTSNEIEITYCENIIDCHKLSPEGLSLMFKISNNKSFNNIMRAWLTMYDPTDEEIVKVGLFNLSYDTDSYDLVALINIVNRLQNPIKYKLFLHEKLFVNDERTNSKYDIQIQQHDYMNSLL